LHTTFVFQDLKEEEEKELKKGAINIIPLSIAYGRTKKLIFPPEQGIYKRKRKKNRLKKRKRGLIEGTLTMNVFF
jgi:hypothetical protein